MRANVLDLMYGAAVNAGPTVLVVTPRAEPATSSTFGDYVRQLMSAAGYEHPTALARAAGVNPTNLIRWIDGTSEPSIGALRKIAPLVGVRLSDLMIRAGVATREELGTVGAPPAPGPPLTQVERTIRSRMMDPRNTERYKRAFHAALLRAIGDFDEVVADLAASPVEPRMRRGARVS